MKKLIISSIVSITVFYSCTTFADEAKERIYLMQILNQLNAIQPFILRAEKEQPKNTRIKFHYQKYLTSDGKTHDGLLEDIQAIKSGIEQKLNGLSIEPRPVAPISGDYLNRLEDHS